MSETTTTIPNCPYRVSYDFIYGDDECLGELEIHSFVATKTQVTEIEELFNAAPDLYAACQAALVALYGLHDGTWKSMEIYGTLRSALLKANGKNEA